MIVEDNSQSTSGATTGFEEVRDFLASKLAEFQDNRRQLDLQDPALAHHHLVQCGAVQIHQVLHTLQDIGLLDMALYPELMEVNGALADIANKSVSPLFNGLKPDTGRPRMPFVDTVARNLCVVALSTMRAAGFSLRDARGKLAKRLQLNAVTLTNGRTISSHQLKSWWDLGIGPGANKELARLIAETSRESVAGGKLSKREATQKMLEYCGMLSRHCPSATRK